MTKSCEFALKNPLTEPDTRHRLLHNQGAIWIVGPIDLHLRAGVRPIAETLLEAIGQVGKDGLILREHLLILLLQVRFQLGQRRLEIHPCANRALK